MPDRITLEQAQRAIAAAFDEATRAGRNMAAAVVDASGDPICTARMDATHERVLRFAVRKAYTAAVMQRDTLGFKADMERTNRTLAATTTNHIRGTRPAGSRSSRSARRRSRSAVPR